MNRRLRVLFLCSGNSCRSQMAEGWARHLKSDSIEAYSAGINVHGLNRVAVNVMAEAGVNIAQYRSKSLHDLGRVQFDYVVTVCTHADEQCPVFPGPARVIHVPFDDPPALAANLCDEEAAMNVYRRVRDEIRAFVEDLPRGLEKGPETMSNASAAEAAEEMRAIVREGYGQIAREGGSCCKPAQKSCCGGGDAEALAKNIGYDAAELAVLPDGANMGLSCGNPTAIAELKPGEVLVDLGSGGGFDAFIAGRKVGEQGRVIGVDMTPDMITKARRNLKTYVERTGLSNVEFRLGEIEHLPVPDDTADAIISNCVINLSPDKPQVWHEIARVLKPGGRVAVSDIALLHPLPEELRKMAEAIVGCVAGAVLASETERMAREAGLVDIVLTPKAGYVDSMTDVNDPLYARVIQSLPQGTKPGDFITSLYVTARKRS